MDRLVQLPQSILDNLHFLATEVGSQLENLSDFLQSGAPTYAQRVLDRSGYAHNLMSRIHSGCQNVALQQKLNNQQLMRLRALETVSVELDMVAGLCRDAVNEREIRRCKDKRINKNFLKMLNGAITGVGMIVSAIEADDTRIALKIAKTEARIAKGYHKIHRYITGHKQKNRCNMESALSLVVMAYSINKVGRSIRRISEVVISSSLGRPMSLEQYHSMKASVTHLLGDDADQEMLIERIAETRSGSGISGITLPEDDEGSFSAIYKDGKKNKLKEERDGVESWHEIYPGLAPKILSYKKRGESAALLIEHLAGLTFEQILLHEPQRQIDKAFKHLTRTLESVWGGTRTNKKVSGQFMPQLQRRLKDVYAVHPEFSQPGQQLGELKIVSFNRLVEKAANVERRYKAPFSVYIHGDFNLDNIIFDPLEKRINFIDLHRSCYMDYLQDISVFMVSIYRLQILDPVLRGRMLQVAIRFYHFAVAYAQKAGDEDFEIRLAFALGRSFATSTRFILDKSLSHALFVRARFLLELAIVAAAERESDFRIPIEEIFVA